MVILSMKCIKQYSTSSDISLTKGISLCLAAIAQRQLCYCPIFGFRPLNTFLVWKCVNSSFRSSPSKTKRLAEVNSIGLLHLISPPPPGLRNHGILQGWVIKIEDFFRGRLKKIWNSLGVKPWFSQNSSRVNPYSSGVWPNSSGVNPYFIEVFRGEYNFIQSSGVRRKGKPSTGGYGF